MSGTGKTYKFLVLKQSNVRNMETNKVAAKLKEGTEIQVKRLLKYRANNMSKFHVHVVEPVEGILMMHTFKGEPFVKQADESEVVPVAPYVKPKKKKTKRAAPKGAFAKRHSQSREAEYNKSKKAQNAYGKKEPAQATKTTKSPPPTSKPTPAPTSTASSAPSSASAAADRHIPLKVVKAAKQATTSKPSGSGRRGSFELPAGGGEGGHSGSDGEDDPLENLQNGGRARALTPEAFKNIDLTKERGDLVTGLERVLLKVCYDNNPKPNRHPTKFHASMVPGLKLGPYLERIAKYSECSEACLILAYVYAMRLTERKKTFLLNHFCVHQLIITCIMTAAKFFDDKFFNNKFYGKVGGISSEKISELELELLMAIDFNLHVFPTEFFQRRSELLGV